MHMLLSARWTSLFRLHESSVDMVLQDRIVPFIPLLAVFDWQHPIVI